jgi:hypothetical protein
MLGPQSAGAPPQQTVFTTAPHPGVVGVGQASQHVCELPDMMLQSPW